MSLLKNPMILIAVVGFAAMYGMPKLMDNSDYNPDAAPEENANRM
jgi:hypothetical protein